MAEESRPACRSRSAPETGYSLVEVLLSLFLLAAVMAAAYAVLGGQRRYHAAVERLAHARDAARVSVEVLTSELRAVSPGAGDLYAVAPDSIALRSLIGFGYVCTASESELTLRRIYGVVGESGRDSVLVFAEASGGRPAGWFPVEVRGVRSGGPGRCPDGGPPDLEVRTGPLPDGVEVGAPCRAFRPYVYRLYRDGAGEWWLGQRPRKGTIQPLAGPFLEPGLGGLHFEPLGSDGRATNEPTEVVRVGVSVAVRRAPATLSTAPSLIAAETLSTVVFLRNARVADTRGGSSDGQS